MRTIAARGAPRGKPQRRVRVSPVSSRRCQLFTMWRSVALSLVAVAAANGDDNSRSPSLEEREHAADAAGTLCDPVKQYSGYFKLYPGKPGAAKNYFVR